MMLTTEQTEALARAGFTASNDSRDWDDINDNERELWRLAAPYTTPREIRLGRFTGYYGRLDWEDLPPHSKSLWRRIYVAMLDERRRLGLPLTGPRTGITITAAAD